MLNDLIAISEIRDGDIQERMILRVLTIRKQNQAHFQGIVPGNDDRRLLRFLRNAKYLASLKHFENFGLGHVLKHQGQWRGCLDRAIWT